MKAKKWKMLNAMYWLALILMASCADEKYGPVLPDSASFVAPALKNDETADIKILSVSQSDSLYERFEWVAADFGIQASVDYVLQAAATQRFDSVHVLANTNETYADITVGQLNTAMLKLELPSGKQGTVYIRIKALINGSAIEAKYSTVLTRIAAPFETSQCGNFCSVGLIGDATVGGWDTDIDMHLADPTGEDKSTWAATLYLKGGLKVKFRAVDAWDNNWGGDAFPAGTASAGGADIVVSEDGYYAVQFNDNSGAYQFNKLDAPTFGRIGVLGTAAPGGWDEDLPLMNHGDPHLWACTVQLTDGVVKFRADESWDNNWGGSAYPSGYAKKNGEDIPVKSGTYFIEFNDLSGEYHFMEMNNAIPYETVGLVGPAQAGGWDADSGLILNPNNPYRWSGVLVLSDGEAKFRADHAWDVNWGATDFPQGIGQQNGANIPVLAGTYFVSFHSGTGEYIFLK